MVRSLKSLVSSSFLAPSRYRKPLLLATSLLAFSCATQVDEDHRQRQQSFYGYTYPEIDGHTHRFYIGAIDEELQAQTWTDFGGGFPDEWRLILGGPSVPGNVPVTVRARELTEGAEANVVPWRYQGPLLDSQGNPLVANVPKMIATDGVHRLFDRESGEEEGFQFEAGRAERVTNVTKRVSFDPSFQPSEKPVVFATQVSNNDEDPTVVRVTNVDVDGFDLYLAEEGGEAHFVAETVHWIAFERGEGEFTDWRSLSCDYDGCQRMCEAVVTGTVVTDEQLEEIPANPNPFWADYDAYPQFFALQTDNGEEAAQAQYLSLPQLYFQPRRGIGYAHYVYVAEEGSNGETDHPDEEIGYLVTARVPCVSDGDPEGF